MTEQELHWSQEFAFKIALGMDPIPEILAQFHVEAEYFDRLRKNPAFMQDVSNYTFEINEKCG
jgi:hypothetical protein